MLKVDDRAESGMLTGARGTGDLEFTMTVKDIDDGDYLNTGGTSSGSRLDYVKAAPHLRDYNRAFPSTRKLSYSIASPLTIAPVPSSYVEIIQSFYCRRTKITST